MDKFEEIDKILKEIAHDVKNKPDYMLNDYNTFYTKITRLGVSEIEMHYDIKELYFSYWINRFKDTPNINVLCDEIKHPYWCQFFNGDITNMPTHIKMYIPLRIERLAEGANLIFDFLAQNDIKHESKIGKEVRLDGLVVRLTSKEDALKLARFVNSTPFIKEGLYRLSPFLLNDGNISYTTDGFQSFNREISKFIRDYMELCYNKGTLDYVSSEDFLNYIKNVRYQVFELKDQQALSSFLETRNIAIIDYKTLAEFYEISKLITYSLDKEKDLNSLMQIYDEMNDRSYMKGLENSLICSQEYEMISRKLEDVICASFKKYGYAYTYGALSRLALLDKNDMFEDMNEKLNGITASRVKDIINQKYGFLDYDTYLKDVLKTRGEIVKNDQELDLEKLKSSVLSHYMTHKYLETKFAISEFLKNGSTSCFTKVGGARFIMRSLNPQKVKNIIVSECGELNIDLYLNKYLKALEIKCNALEEAAIATLKKFDDREHLINAIKEAKNGNFIGFTRAGDLDLRGNLMRNVTPGEIDMVLNATLIKYGIDSENDLIEEYLNNLEAIAGMKTNNPENLGQR